MKDYYNTSDPQNMEARFSNEDSFAYMLSIFNEPTPEDLQRIRYIRDLLDFIPQREADFMEMYFFKQIRQLDIARMFRVSQPTVCYRLKRAAVRIRFLLEIVHVPEAEIRADLEKAGVLPKDVNIIVGMIETTCQSKVAAMIDSTQNHVRHRFLGVTAKLCAENPYIREKYKKTFDLVKDNPNILRDVSKKVADSEIHYMVLTS